MFNFFLRIIFYNKLIFCLFSLSKKSFIFPGFSWSFFAFRKQLLHTSKEHCLQKKDKALSYEEKHISHFQFFLYVNFKGWLWKIFLLSSYNILLPQSKHRTILHLHSKHEFLVISFKQTLHFLFAYSVKENECSWLLSIL